MKSIKTLNCSKDNHLEKEFSLFSVQNRNMTIITYVQRKEYLIKYIYMAGWLPSKIKEDLLMHMYITRQPFN